jgi:hypothetical protein
MAGLGLRTWVPGEVITANNVQQYLQDQAVQVYNNASARDSNLTGFVSEGMVAYLKDTNKLSVFDGVSWVEIDTEDIDASQITSGVLSASRIPSLPASQITSGTFSLDRLPTITVAKGGTGGTTKATGRNGLGIFVQPGTPSGAAAGDIWVN